MYNQSHCFPQHEDVFWTFTMLCTYSKVKGNVALLNFVKGDFNYIIYIAFISRSNEKNIFSQDTQLGPFSPHSLN